MGFVPSFFDPALDSPEALHHLWLQTQVGWLDNPLPELLKEKILLLLTRLGPVSLCHIGHACKLYSLGARGVDILELVSQPVPEPPSDADLERLAALPVLEAGFNQIFTIEAALLQASDWSFLDLPGSDRSSDQISRILGPERFLHWLALLSFAKMRNVWSRAHPEVVSVPDERLKQGIEELVREEPGLASRLTQGFVNAPSAVLSPASTNDEPSSEVAADDIDSRLSRVIDCAPDFIAVIKPDGGSVFVNRAARQAFGYPEDQDAETISLVWMHPGSVNAVFTPSRIAAAIASGTWTGENVIITTGGREIPVSQVIVAHTGANGEVQFLSTIARDITQQKRSERALAESERRFRALTENSDDGLAMLDAQERFIFCSASTVRIIGFDITGRLLSDFVHPDDLEELQGAMRSVFAVPGKVHQFEVRIRQNRVWRNVEASLMNRLEDPDLSSVIMNFRDVTGRREVEGALRESEERFRLLIENAPVGIRIARANLLLYANPAYVRQFGYSEFLELAGKSVVDLVSPQRRDVIAAAIAEHEHGITAGTEWQSSCLRKDGSEFPAHVAVRRIQLPGGPAAVAFVTDLTQRHALEERVGRADQLESIGQLAGGIAHDFNNLFTIIQAHCELLMESLDGSVADRERAQEISAAVQQGSDLTKQLMTFSRRQPIDLVPSDLNEIIQGTLERMGPLWDDIRIETNLFKELPTVSVDRGLIDQVMLNLIVNARDALPNGGVISIKSERVVLDPEAVTSNPDAYGGEFVRIRVADTGLGIPSEDLDRIYEPFFSTKSASCGAGLGLATAYGAIKQHKGWIEVSSKLAEGTVFDIFLPVTQGNVPQQSGSEPVNQLDGQETVLVVEDESSLRRLLAHALRRQGYNVLEADVPGVAQEIWKEHQEKIDLVITDIVMPGGQNGWELAKLFFRDRPGLKVLFMSGYFGDMPTELNVNESNFIRKPFLPKDMLSRVRSLLDKD